jgi:hypothetical protein
MTPIRSALKTGPSRSKGYRLQTNVTPRRTGRKGTMAQRLALPLKIQDGIERAHGEIRKQARTDHDLLFGYVVPLVFTGTDIMLATRRSGGLRLQLQEYAATLFDNEAQYYAPHVMGQTAMRYWLGELATRIHEEVLRDVSTFTKQHDYHCTLEERQKAIADGLNARIEYWVGAVPKDPVLIFQWSQLPGMPKVPDSPAPASKESIGKDRESRLRKLLGRRNESSGAIGLCEQRMAQRCYGPAPGALVTRIRCNL